MLFFFFSSRRRHTRLTCDWSSDVCSSDLIRRTQRDLLEFCTNPKYHEPKWPDDYWPPPGSPEPPNDAAWTEALTTIRADAQTFADFTVKNVATLTDKIPHGTGQTYLRTVLVAVDHASYHVGQIIAVRRL